MQGPLTPSSVDGTKPEIAAKPVFPHHPPTQPHSTPTPELVGGGAYVPQGGAPFGQPIAPGLAHQQQPLGYQPMAQVAGQPPMAANPNIMQGQLLNLVIT